MENNETINCPYDNRHRMNKNKFHNHLLRCNAALNSTDKLMFCKKDMNVWFFKKDQTDHMFSCSGCNPFIVDYSTNTSNKKTRVSLVNHFKTLNSFSDELSNLSQDLTEDDIIVLGNFEHENE